MAASEVEGPKVLVLMPLGNPAFLEDAPTGPLRASCV
eukprot:CAMPEP_0203864338 /NCGR_PEP_ID=MMETSP0359-20131031/14703_1 /ASSEMBLY_ACC=CAM_ASM_000338 /TAXON_ID=268821 /ORGANISM="Scrippsiella Hangoei, Strain SHTV-5" /LENGTH=36 /DNA_ID= /DNA_START= /DNA_END= /DNA_ORIENTATION=